MFLIHFKVFFFFFILLPATANLLFIRHFTCYILDVLNSWPIAVLCYFLSISPFYKLKRGVNRLIAFEANLISRSSSSAYPIARSDLLTSPRDLVTRLILKRLPVFNFKVIFIVALNTCSFGYFCSESVGECNLFFRVLPSCCQDWDLNLSTNLCPLLFTQLISLLWYLKHFLNFTVTLVRGEKKRLKVILPVNEI